MSDSNYRETFDEEEALKEVDLDTFMAELREFVEKFEKTYRDGQATHPDVFPPTMMLGDWWESFQVYEAD